MENTVINVGSLSPDLPFVLYNDWTKEPPQKKHVRTVVATAENANLPKRKHLKQLLFHQSMAKSRFVFGGNRTGKSVCGALETIWYATGTHPYVQLDHACHGWVVSLTRQVQRDVAQAKILQYLPPEWIVKVVMVSGSSFAPAHGVIDFIIVRNVFGTTSKIGFRNCEQGRERFQGVSLDYVWFDEEPPEDIYDECLLRLLDSGGVHWVTMTPLKGRSWVYERIYLNRDQLSDLDCFFMSWDDNPYLQASEKKYLEDNLPADVLESRKYGHFMAAEGLVFPNFTTANIVEPFVLPAVDDYYLALDPGYRNPTGAVWLAVCGEQIYVVSDYEVAGLTVAENAANIKERTAALGWDLRQVKILIDSAANQKTAACEVSAAEMYRQCGLPVDSNVNKNVLMGILRLKSLLANAAGQRSLFIFKNCVNLIAELRGYAWGDGEQPKKVNDHTIDALRYAVMHLEQVQAQRKPSLGVLGQNKQRMIKNLAVKRFDSPKL